ncbi:hypothetical protein [Bradyrhizobium iriomotense]|uniref:Secreted protein n=1 Tax=Bradyrhizobium iriomotense TaxID=441950 RepID=A0ABQ6BA00_9BRAD|nr:hypothetical protein [Bradyrhizobium iriomotense]GLR91229.1 hypothetical protein GCM10007857_79460 [Bradyrhizobium iriomotense]
MRLIAGLRLAARLKVIRLSLWLSKRMASVRAVLGLWAHERLRALEKICKAVDCSKDQGPAGSRWRAFYSAWIKNEYIECSIRAGSRNSRERAA